MHAEGMDQQRKKRSSKDNFNSRNVNEEQLGRFFSLEKSSGKTLLQSRTVTVLLVKSEDLNCIDAIT